MLSLYLQAPFAAFRTFTAGSYRPTAGFITHSAAYGLLMNAAGVEMRGEDMGKGMTAIRDGLPRFRIALGALSFPNRHDLFQQLHNYPVGTSGKEHAPACKGAKYNIAPVRRAFLSDLRAYVCLDGDLKMEEMVLAGLAGRGLRAYGLLFLGDNNFLPDRFEPVRELEPAHWFDRVVQESDARWEWTTRLTISIDREDMSRTRSALFAPQPVPSSEIPPGAWVEVGY